MGYHSLTTTAQPSALAFHLQDSTLPLDRVPLRSLSLQGAGPQDPLVNDATVYLI